MKSKHGNSSNEIDLAKKKIAHMKLLLEKLWKLS